MMATQAYFNTYTVNEQKRQSNPPEWLTIVATVTALIYMRVIHYSAPVYYLGLLLWGVCVCVCEALVSIPYAFGAHVSFYLDNSVQQQQQIKEPQN
jgi:hypothetical protein